MAWLDLEAEIAEEFGELERAELDTEQVQRWEAHQADRVAQGFAASRAKHRERYRTDPEYREKCRAYLKQWRAKQAQDPAWLEKRREYGRQWTARQPKAPLRTVACGACGGAFTTTRSDRRYCGRRCKKRGTQGRWIKRKRELDLAWLQRRRARAAAYGRARRATARRDQLPMATACVWCGVAFPASGRKRYCARPCKQKAFGARRKTDPVRAEVQRQRERARTVRRRKEKSKEKKGDTKP
jgi:hypothetical protein